MNLPLSDEAAKFMELTFKPGTWDDRGIPETGFRLRTAAMVPILASGGSCQVEQLIHGLMDWLDVTDDPEPALQALRQMLDRYYPDDGRSHARCRFAPDGGGDFIFDVARQIDCDEPVIAWQRRQWVIAVASSGAEAGRMVVGAPAPISLAVARSIHGHSLVSFMLEPFDSFEAARATSGKTGSYYSWEAGQATLVDWQHGLGKTMHDNALIVSEALAGPPEGGWLAPNQLAIQVAIAEGYVA